MLRAARDAAQPPAAYRVDEGIAVAVHVSVPAATVARHHTATTTRTEFAATSTTASAPTAPTGVVLHSGSPEPSAPSREFASEFGG
jgi:hypothetical protein